MLVMMTIMSSWSYLSVSGDRQHPTAVGPGSGAAADPDRRSWRWRSSWRSPDEATAVKHYQRFKECFVALLLADRWAVEVRSVRAWLALAAAIRRPIRPYEERERCQTAMISPRMKSTCSARSPIQRH